MSNNLGYWYSEMGGGSYINELPPQALDSKEKNKDWEKATMDALERIGTVQFRDNMKFRDFYRMIDGKMSYTELSEVIPQLREVGEMLDDMEIPTNIKHYDLIGIIINALVGEYLQNTDKFNATNIDEIATNEYERQKGELTLKHIQEKFEEERKRRMVERGWNPDTDKMEFKSEEEKQAYIEQMEGVKRELTPPEIEQFMNTKWRTKATVWAEHTLEADKTNFKMDKLDRVELRDFLLTGRCFRHFRIGYDYYKPETWSPLTTFFSKSLDTEYVEDDEYVGRIHYYTPSQIINKYGHKMSKDQKEDLMGNKEYSYQSSGTSDLNFNKVMGKNFGETQILPHKQYHDHNFMVGLQEQFGVPMAEKTIFTKDGAQETVPSYLPSYNTENKSSSHYAQQLRDDIPLSSNMIKVTEAYWISYKKIGYLTYETESGMLTQEIVTDDLLPAFLKENGIKQVNNRTLEQVEDKPEPNTIVWDYIPEAWQGVKINEGNTSMKTPIYIDIKPCEVQIKGDSNVYEVKLPVVGVVSKSLALKMQPFQVGHNIAMNQLYNLLEKEIGMFFIFDVNFLPSEYKDWGDTEETLVHLRNLTKDTGLFPVDTSKQNVRDGGGFNQFAPQNLSFTAQIADRIQLSEFYKNKAFEQIGFNPQRLGTPVKYETAEGVRQNQDASYAQTEVYFETFSEYKHNALEMHLSVAQYAQKESKDIRSYYTKSDQSKAYLKFTDPYFHLRKLGILPVSNSKKRRELENFKSYLLNTNTLAGDELAIAKLFQSDTMVELMDMAKSERMARQKREDATYQQQNQLLDKESQLREQEKIEEWKRNEITNEKDRINKIDVEKIESLGRAVDANADQSSIDFIVNQADLAIKKQKVDDDRLIKMEENSRKKIKDKQDFAIRMKELKNETLKVQAQLQTSKDKKYIAEINKN